MDNDKNKKPDFTDFTFDDLNNKFKALDKTYISSITLVKPVESDNLLDYLLVNDNPNLSIANYI